MHSPSSDFLESCFLFQRSLVLSHNSPQNTQTQFATPGPDAQVSLVSCSSPVQETSLLRLFCFVNSKALKPQDNRLSAACVLLVSEGSQTLPMSPPPLRQLARETRGPSFPSLFPSLPLFFPPPLPPSLPRTSHREALARGQHLGGEDGG